MSREGEYTPSAERGWKQRSIELSYRFEGKIRGLDAYELALGFKREELRDKIILDLGAGTEEQFAKEVEQSQLGAKVIGLSPDFIFSDIRKKTLAEKPEQDAVIGLGQQLPFKNESFDDVLVMHVVEHMENWESLVHLLKETARVIKPGGRAYFGPIFSYIREKLNPSSEEMYDLEQRGISVTWENIPERYGLEPLYDDVSGLKYGRTEYSRLILEKSLEEPIASR